MPAHTQLSSLAPPWLFWEMLIFDATDHGSSTPSTHCPPFVSSPNSCRGVPAVSLRVVKSRISGWLLAS
jgi:hypothetical protein